MSTLLNLVVVPHPPHAAPSIPPHPPGSFEKGWSLANEMLVMGRKLSAQEALATGLVSTLVTADTEVAFLRQASFVFVLILFLFRFDFLYMIVCFVDHRTVEPRVPLN